nr:hypothetical protein B0A51_01005 [Rachicladosporium sp. CCFEE 5018]
MAATPPARAASVADRRASAALRQQSTRPTSAATERLRGSIDETRSNGSDLHRKRTTTTTTETTRRRVLEQEAILRRTKVPLQPSHASEQRRPSVRPDEQPVPKAAAAKTGPISPSQPWRPTATLLPPTPMHAPLASRISIPPQAKHAPDSVQPSSMGSMSLQKQERALMDDLLYVLLGFEGQHVTFATQRTSTHEPYDPFDEQSRLVGSRYTIASGIDPSLRDLAMQVLKTATHAAALDAFGDVMSRNEYGSVSHALCSAVRKLQKDFLVLVTQLEHSFLNHDSFSLHQMSLQLRKSAHVLSLLYTLAQEVLKENGLLGDTTDGNESDEDDEDEFENVLASLRDGGGASTRGKKSCIGGALLVLLSRRLQAMSGDPQAKDLLSLLLRDASRPYLRMLNEWLHHGNVKDPHQEFMVKETKSIKRELLEQDYTDEYWEKRYTLRPELVPIQLESVKDRVLLAGKYLNVVRECSTGVVFSSTFSTDLSASAHVPHDIFAPAFLSNVNTAYIDANRALMALLLTTHQLPQRLRSLKHYFFLDRSDWFTYFLELSHSELRKSAKSANVGKLQSLLDLVLHTPGSIASDDPFKEDVRISMSETGLVGWLMRVVNVQGMDADATSLTNSYTPAPEGSVSGKDDKEIAAHEALTLDFGVPFPLSLIISRVTLTRYQLLFRYLLGLKHLEGQLINSWTDAGGIGGSVAGAVKGAKGRDVGIWRRKTGNPKIELWKKRAWTLRSRMLTFTQQLLYFCTAEVIEPHWRAFMSRLEESSEGDATATKSTSGEPNAARRTVDELMQDHVDFLATCLKECMLTNAKLLRINSKVTSTCLMFANYTASLTRSLDAASPAFTPTPSAPTPPPIDEAKLEKLFSILTQYEQHFSRHLKILLDALNYLAATETVGFLGLCARLSMAAEGGDVGGGFGRRGPGVGDGV